MCRRPQVVNIEKVQREFGEWSSKVLWLWYKRQKTECVVSYVENDQNCAVFIGLAKCRQTNVICIGCEVSHIYIKNVARRHIVNNTRDQETLRHLLQLYVLLMFDI